MSTPVVQVRAGTEALGRVDVAASTVDADARAWLAERRAGREMEHARRTVLRRELRQRHAQARRAGKAVGNARRLAEAEFRRALSAVNGDAGVALYRDEGRS